MLVQLYIYKINLKELLNYTGKDVRSHELAIFKAAIRKLVVKQQI